MTRRLSLIESTSHIAISSHAISGNLAIDHRAQLDIDDSCQTNLSLASGPKPIRIAYRWVGATRAPIFVVMGGISAGRHTAMDSREQVGWWSEIVGPGLGIDLNACSVLSFDYVGGSGHSSGPQDLATDPAWAHITTAEQAQVCQRLLQHLGIPRVDAVIGASYGGMVGLAFAQQYPHLLKRLVALCAAHRSAPSAQANRWIQQSITRFGLRANAGREALALARQLAMTTYRTAKEFDQRFDNEDPALALTDISNYLSHCGERFVSSHEPESFLCLSNSIDTHHVSPHSITTPTTLIGITSDRLVPLSQVKRLNRQLAGPSDFIEIDSLYGHDAFLKEVTAISSHLKHTLFSGEPTC